MALFSDIFNELLIAGCDPERLKPDDLPAKPLPAMTAEERQRIDVELAIAKRLEAMRLQNWEDKMTSELPADIRMRYG